MNGSATVGQDYEEATGSLTFEPGVTVQSFPVALLDDLIEEGDETLNLLLSDPQGGVLGEPSLAILTILDTPGDGARIGFTAPTFSAGEASEMATLTLVRSGSLVGSVTAEYSLTDLSAVAPGDYQPTVGTVTFEAGSTSATIYVHLEADDLLEGTERFEVRLLPVLPAQLEGSATAEVELVDDLERPAPKSLVITRLTSGYGAQLAWTDACANETCFVIERSVNGGASWNTVTTPTSATGVGSRVVSTIRPLSVGSAYKFRVRSCNSTALSNPSNEGIIDFIPPAAPTRLIATPMLGGRIKLTWIDKADNETGFRIERSTDNLSFQGVTSTIAAAGTGLVCSYVNAGLTTGTRYYYRVFAYNALPSAVSNVANALAWGTLPLPDWPRRTPLGTVHWGPGITPVTGVANHPANSGQTSAETMILSHYAGTLRQNGLVKRLRFHIANLAGITGFYVKVWEPTTPLTTNYTLRSATPNLAPYLVEGMNDLTFARLSPPLPDLPVREGDRYGFRIEWAGKATTLNLCAQTDLPGTFTCYVMNQASKAGSFLWGNQIKLVGTAFPVEFFGDPPQFVGFGDSLTSGNGGGSGIPAHGSYLETGSAENLPNSWMWQLSYLFGGVDHCSNQNLGRSGERSDQLAVRVQGNLIDLHPAVASICVGTNDVVQATSQETFLESYRVILDACLADGIVPVVSLIPPYSPLPYTHTIYLERQARRRQFNTALLPLLHSYGTDIQGRPRVVVVNQEPYVSQPGYPDLLQPLLTPDGIHFLQSGKLQQARAVTDAMQRDGYATGVAGF